MGEDKIRAIKCIALVDPVNQGWGLDFTYLLCAYKRDKCVFKSSSMGQMARKTVQLSFYYTVSGHRENALKCDIEMALALWKKYPTQKLKTSLNFMSRTKSQLSKIVCRLQEVLQNLLGWTIINDWVHKWVYHSFWHCQKMYSHSGVYMMSNIVMFKKKEAVILILLHIKHFKII